MEGVMRSFGQIVEGILIDLDMFFNYLSKYITAMGVWLRSIIPTNINLDCLVCFEHMNHSLSTTIKNRPCVNEYSI